MNVLSLFDGISCGQIAFERNGIKFDGMRERESNNYFASEIKPIAIKVTQENYPNTIQVGDVCKLHYENDRLYKDCIHNEDDTWELGTEIPNSHIDMLIGGSPCQDLCSAGSREGLKGEKSKLFFEYLRLLKECSPKYFLLENNNSMSKQNKNKITEYLKVMPVLINSSLVSAQERRRLYWTNINILKLPTDKRLVLEDILENKVNKQKYNITQRFYAKKIGTLSYEKSRKNLRTIKQNEKENK
jgi:site-specific DNA-cytosine methylase